MDLEVLKFGGSSLATAETMDRVGSVLLRRREVQRIVVCSAMGGVTNALIEMGQRAARQDEGYSTDIMAISNRHYEVCSALNLMDAVPDLADELNVLLEEMKGLCAGIYMVGELSGKSLDQLVSFGERLAVPVVTALLKSHGMTIRRVDARDWICTDNSYGSAQVDLEKTTALILSGVSENMDFEILITEGFIGRDPQGHTTTLGRGGSDYTASLIAKSVQANAMEKSTDVPGMMTADPRIVPQARIIETMSYEEAMELCHFGAKVIYHPTIEPLRDQNIPLIIRSTFDSDHPGTRVVSSPTDTALVRGISSVSEISLLTLEGGGVIGKPGFSRRVFTALVESRINVILITQSSSEYSLTVGVSDSDLEMAQIALNNEFESDMMLNRLSPLRVDSGLSILALVGGGMQSEVGVSGRAFEALARAGINIRAIAQGSTERNISIVLSTLDISSALRALHRAFFETPVHRLNLCCIGLGQVGSAMFQQLEANEALWQKEGIEMRVVGVANSSRYCLDANGINPRELTSVLREKGTPCSDPQEILQHLGDLLLPNVVWVDNTASDAVARMAAQALSKGISVVCSNKIAAVGAFSEWQFLIRDSHPRGARFLNETNVGAALPVIDVVRQLRRVGDVVHRMEAVLSGSLNFIFSRMDDGVSFTSALNEAGERGFTEPDPRLDLGGVDVARKLLILAREMGHELELSSIDNVSFLPAHAFDGDSDAFLLALPACEAAVQDLFQKATQNQKRLRFVAEFKNGCGQVALKMLASDHPFFSLKGSDNALALWTDRYRDHPLVIQGSGAGADLTASGVIGDLLRYIPLG